MFLHRSEAPFAEGESRIAYHGQLAQSKEELAFKTSAAVFKSLKHLGAPLHDRSQYLKQMEVSSVAHFLAVEYNKVRPKHCAPVHFLPVRVVEEKDDTNEALGERRFCVEPPLPSNDFVKFSSNTGFWDEDYLDESLLRFTMFTHTQTHGYLMIADLQGCKVENEYYLTDPVVLCEDVRRFGRTNLGEKFMEKVVASTKGHMHERGWKLAP